MALGGTFGYELDITKCSDEEKAEIRNQVAMYHKFNDLVREGNFYRMNENFGEESINSYAYVAKDKSEALVILTQKINVPCNKQQIQFVRVPDIDDDALYEVNGEYTLYGSTLKNLGISSERTLFGHATFGMYHVVKVDK